MEWQFVVEGGDLSLLIVGMPCSDDARSYREQLSAAIEAVGLPVHLREAAEFHPLDEGVLYTSSDTKDAIVCVLEDVAWGPQIESYVEPADEMRSRPILMIDIPNSLNGRVPEVLEILRQWFDG